MGRSRRKAVAKARSKAPAAGAAQSGKRKRPAQASALRRLNDNFRERRFPAKTGTRDLLGVIAMSLGAIALGAGTYAMGFWQHAKAPGYAPFLVAAGLALVAIYMFMPAAGSGALVVGELGVGFERDGKLDRLAWYEITGLTLEHEALRLRTAGKPLSVVVSEHPAGASLIVAEALQRIPERVDVSERDLERLGPPRDGAGEERGAGPPQVTELTCRASQRPLTFERDVRVCGRCAAAYHREGMPQRCLECSEQLG